MVMFPPPADEPSSVSLRLLLSNVPTKKELPNVETETIEEASGREWTYYLLPAIVLMMLTVVVGLLAEPVYQVSLTAAEQLMDPSGYLNAVLGGQ